MQRFYDIFINNLCLIEVTFVAWKSQWNFFCSFFVSNFSLHQNGVDTWCEFSLEGWKSFIALESAF